MRNIYDIIAEQKAMVDVNMAKYDLNYTVDHFFTNDYLQEGVGDAVKNAAQKVIVFIKTLMAKIKELIKKMLNYLGVRQPKVTMDDLKNAKKDEDAKPEAEQDKKAEGEKESPGNYYDTKIHAGKDPDSLSEDDILRGSLRKVNMIKYVEFGIKKQITVNFMDAVYQVAELHNSDLNEAGPRFMKALERQCFKGDGSFKKNKDMNIVDRIKAELKEPTEPEDIVVKDIPGKLIFSYVEEDLELGADDLKNRGVGIRKFLNSLDDNATKSLNKLKSKLEGLQNGGTDVGADSFSNIQKVLTMTSTFISYMTTNIFNAYNKLWTIFEQAIMDYMRAYKIKLN